MEWQDGGRTGTPLRAMGRQKEREASRGGESKAKALAEAGRGVVRAKRGGAAADCARSAKLANGVSANTHRSQNALAAGWRALMPTLARRAATRSARVGAAQQRCAACARPARGEAVALARA